MSKETFPFTSTSLRSLRVEQELQEWEDARRALAHRRAMSRAPLPPAPRPPPRHQERRRVQEVRAAPPQVRCRDTAIHNTFMCGDMKGVYAVLKDPAMSVFAPCVPVSGMWTLSSKVKQTSALRLAASRGHSSCVEELLFRGAEANADPGGNTALHDACIGGHSVCVQLLLSHGADPELLTSDGCAPLHLCTSAQSFHCAELLLDDGAEVNVRMRESRLTPLHVAARRGLEKHVELFLSHNADVKATNREGETPLNAACSGAERPSEAGRYLGVVQMLMEAGADPRTAGRKMHTPLHNACANCSPRIVEILLQHGAKADVSNSAGFTPLDCLLQVALKSMKAEQEPGSVARSLLNHGAKPVPPKMLKQCILSPATLEVLLNSYTSIPPCDWMDSLPTDVYESFFDLVHTRSNQPRSLQHLCRCALRLPLGARCFSVLSKLDIPRSHMHDTKQP
uniref:Ankyrin repeat and SOCS box containing 16 n=1 Tax=Sphaeramia orbicularis TaxID=375764 RepID=A0A673AFU7_9TELE